MDGIELILQERQRQVDEEGWSADHDDLHKDGEMAVAAACYALAQTKAWFVIQDGLRQLGQSVIGDVWTWAEKWWKPAQRGNKGRIRNLTKSGALIAAEIDRLLRQE